MAVHVNKSRADFEQEKQLARLEYSAHFNKEMLNWMMIYPAYINAKKTIATGRQISISESIDNPTAKEIADVLAAKGFEVLLEDRKVHPREPLRDSIHCGRVRVLFWTVGENGKKLPINPMYGDRKYLMKLAAQSISKLQSRQNKSKSQTPATSQSGHNKGTNTQKGSKGGKKGKK